MEGSKFMLKSMAVLGSLATIFSAGYLVATGQPPGPEDVAAVGELASKAGEQVAGVVALLGGITALIGRLRAKKQVTLIPGA